MSAGGRSSLANKFSQDLASRALCLVLGACISFCFSISRLIRSLEIIASVQLPLSWIIDQSQAIPKGISPSSSRFGSMAKSHSKI